MASIPYCIQAWTAELHSAGLPHSVTRGSQDVCSSPRLFAAYHDLLRRIAPRHPPWTLVRLTIFLLHPLGSQAFRLYQHTQTANTQAAHTPNTVLARSLAPSGLLFPSLFMSKIKKTAQSTLRGTASRTNNRSACGNMGLTRLELVTPSLSEKCSNRLSYRPEKRGQGKRDWS